MKLSAWASSVGISYKTAWRMWKAKTLPVPAYQLPTGTIVVKVDAEPLTDQTTNKESNAKIK